MAQYLDWFQACGRSAPGWEKIMRCFNSLERDPMQKRSSIFADRAVAVVKRLSSPSLLPRQENFRTANTPKS
jgi:hypothetical protein